MQTFKSEKPLLSKVPFGKPRLGQNVASSAVLTANNERFLYPLLSQRVFFSSFFS